jgi:hypothetical protein
MYVRSSCDSKLVENVADKLKELIFSHSGIFLVRKHLENSMNGHLNSLYVGHGFIMNYYL